MDSARGRKKKWEELLDRLQQEFRRRERQLEVLHSIDKAIIDRDNDLKSVYKLIVEQAKTLLNAKYVQLMVRRGHKTMIVEGSSNPTDIGKPLEIEMSLTGKCLRTDQRIIVPDVEKESLYVRMFDTLDDPIQSELCVPIRLANGPIGVINVESPKLNAYDVEDAGLCESLAAQAAVAFEHSRLFNENHLFEVIERSLFSPDEQNAIRECLGYALTELKQYVDIDRLQVLLLRSDVLEVVFSTNPRDVGLTVLVSDSVCGRTVRNGITEVVADVTTDEEYKRILGGDIKSEIAVPVIIDGMTVGVLNVESPEHDAFDAYYRYILERFATQVGLLIALGKLRSELSEAYEQQHADEVLLALGNNAAHMIHRLNNHIAPIKYWVREIQGNFGGILQSSPALADALTKIAAYADDALNLPRELQAMILNNAPVDVNEVIRQVVGQTPFPENVNVTMNLADGLPNLQLVSFGLVVRNLVKNAVEAMERGGELTLTTRKIDYENVGGGYVDLEVRDTGCGIDEKTRRRVFEMSFTTKKEKEGKGLGFGLWWVRQFVRHVKGEISVTSEPNKGSVFRVRLPINGSARSELRVTDEVVSER